MAGEHRRDSEAGRETAEWLPLSPPIRGRVGAAGLPGAAGPRQACS